MQSKAKQGMNLFNVALGIRERKEATACGVSRSLHTWCGRLSNMLHVAASYLKLCVGHYLQISQLNAFLCLELKCEAPQPEDVCFTLGCRIPCRKTDSI